MQSRPLEWLPLVAVIATAVMFSLPPADTGLKLFPDSSSYLNFSLVPDPAKTTAYGRPPTGFLYWWLLGTSPSAVYVQTVLSLVCWTTLGWVTLGTAGAVFAAALAGSLWVSMWSYTVLSEPPTLSFGAAIVAATLVLGRHWSWPRFAVWLGCAFMFANLRLENVFLVFVLLGALLVWHTPHWRALGIAGVALGAVFVFFGLVLDKQNNNWNLRMINVVLTRILPEPELAEWFAARGLPREEIKPFQGRMLAGYDPTFAPATPEFQRWLAERSRAAYFEYLSGRDPHRRLLESMDRITIRYPESHNYYAAGVKYPGAVLELVPFFDAVRLPFTYWKWLAAIPLLCALLSWRVLFADVFALAYLLGVYVTAFVVYHADTGELERHMSFVYMLYRMAPLVVLAGAWERLLALGRRWWDRAAEAHVAAQ